MSTTPKTFQSTSVPMDKDVQVGGDYLRHEILHVSIPHTHTENTEGAEVGSTPLPAVRA